ncbi:MAG: DNA polymerase III subunit gamma/tau [Erysipelotrichia bacterium]|nr:DNA polymerase III subunit gamma/tau [Erysipelotrichia bacterium]
MAYKALYRKYRPTVFSEVVGQQYIIATLQNAIKNNKLAHAYLFCGPRGTGKTTIAKILAKTINCQNEDVNLRPCGKCASCIDIQQSVSPDVIEMDAATNNGVDEVRELIDKVKYAPMNGKYKVYIIDEVHMMTVSAFNALLKTLEEPPEYCIFILATTEPHKVLPTIVSRCQRFDFKKIAVPVIVGNLRNICQKENVNCSEEALKLIASLADGGMRDALSILDQCISYKDNNIELEDVGNVYGVATLSEKMDLFREIKNQDTVKIVNKINEIAEKGIDISRLTTDMINIAKESVIYGYSKNEDILEVIDGDTAAELLKMFSSTKLLTFIDNLIETQSKYREATSALTYFEICLLKMMDISRENTESKQENIIVKEVENLPISSNVYIDYTDEEYYDILTKANKRLKEMDNKIIANLPSNSFTVKENNLLARIKKAPIMASSQDKIIFTVSDRIQANEINEAENNRILKELLGKYLPSNKDIIAVTEEQRDYLITYFRSRQNTSRKEEVKPETSEKTAEDRLGALFGKDGFDVVEGD